MVETVTNVTADPVEIDEGEPSVTVTNVTAVTRHCDARY